MNESPASPAPAPESSPEPAPATSIWSRMFNVLATPGDVFDDVRQRAADTWNWLLPAILLTLVGWVGSFLILGQDSVKAQISEMQDKQFQKLVEQGKMSQPQADQARAASEKVTTVAKYVGAVVATLVAAFASPFWWALLLWLAGAKAMGGNFGYMKAVEVAGLANVIVILESVLKSLMIVIFGNLFAGPHLGFLLMKEYDPQNLTHSLLTQVDAMTFWKLAVLAIGLVRLAGVSWVKAAVWVFGLWAFFTGLMIAFGQAMQKLFGG